MKKDKATPQTDDGPIHLVTIDWSRGKWSGTAGKYSREHVWHFAGKLAMRVTDALAPAAYRDSARLDPLKSFVATVVALHVNLDKTADLTKETSSAQAASVKRC